MTQEAVNTDLSGQISTLRDQVTDTMQQLLFRPTQTTYYEGLDSLQQSIDTLNTSLDAALVKWNNLQRLFIDLKYTQNQRFTSFTGFTGIDYRNLSGLVTGLYSWSTGFTGSTFPALTGRVSGNYDLFTGHTGTNPRLSHPPVRYYVNLVTGMYSIGSYDDFVGLSGLDTGPGATGTLPNAASLSGRTYSITRLDNNPGEVMLTGFSESQTICGRASILFPNQYTGLTVVTDGNTWLKIT